MATTKAREDIKADLKTLKEDLKTGAREETQRLRDKAAEAEFVRLLVAPLQGVWQRIGADGHHRQVPGARVLAQVLE